MSSEQLPLLGTVTPQGKETSSKSPPKWVPPPIPNGSTGGYLTSRSNGIGVHLKVGASNLEPLIALLWNPRMGKFNSYFEGVLEGPNSIEDVIFPATFAHEMRLGDWVVVNKIKELNGIQVVEDATVIKPAQHHATYNLDVHWIGPQSKILGEGETSIGLDDKGRTIVLRNNQLKKYFGRLPAKSKRVELLAYDGVTSLDTSYYNLLGLDPPVTDDEVKNAYRNKAKVIHPDVNKSPGAVAEFQELNEAYELLKEEEQRDLYDMCLLMATTSYSKSMASSYGDLLQGLHDGAWYSPVTSGMIQAAGFQTGSVIILTEITKIDPVKQGTKTRVAVEADGMVELYWAEGL